LTENLEKDRKIIEDFISSQNNDVVQFPEFGKLNKYELRMLRESLLTDYKELTIQLINYGQNIRTIQREQFSYFSALLLEHRNLITHDIISNIRGIEYALNKIALKDETFDKKIGEAKQDILKAYDNIKGYEMLAIDEIISPIEIDITKEISDYVSFVQKHSTGNVSVTYTRGESIIVTILRFLINRLLVNVIENSIQVGARNEIEKIEIEIDLTIEKLNENKDQIFMLIIDNCGDFEIFKNVVEKLNSKETILIPSSKNIEKIGNGLSKIKKLLNNKKPWILLPIPNTEKKCLKIPIC
jgi:hypothetical protein